MDGGGNASAKKMAIWLQGKDPHTQQHRAHGWRHRMLEIQRNLCCPFVFSAFFLTHIANIHIHKSRSQMQQQHATKKKHGNNNGNKKYNNPTMFDKTISFAHQYTLVWCSYPSSPLLSSTTTQQLNVLSFNIIQKPPMKLPLFNIDGRDLHLHKSSRVQCNQPSIFSSPLKSSYSNNLLHLHSKYDPIRPAERSLSSMQINTSLMNA